jgi:hypothetical protein
MYFFKLAVKINVVLTMGSPYIMNFMTQLWRFFFSSQTIAHKLLKDLCWPKLSWCQFLVTWNKKMFQKLQLALQSTNNASTPHG